MLAATLTTYLSNGCIRNGESVERAHEGGPYPPKPMCIASAVTDRAAVVGGQPA